MHNELQEIVMLDSIKSYIHLQQKCPTQADCIAYLELIRWNGKVVSPYDESSKVYKCKGFQYKCKNSNKYFNVLKGTMFENTNLPLTTWFYAIWKITTSGSGITSVDLGRDMGIPQKSAWFLLHRIRACCQIENNHKLSGIVGADETWIGGKNKNRHVANKVNYKGARFENPDKSLVLGMLEKGGNIVCKVIHNRSKEIMQPTVLKYVENDTHLITDEHSSYNGLSHVYNHTAINHKAYEYVSKEDSSISNNGIEGTWRILKRTVSGTYHHTSKKHLQSYVDEFVYRYNTRKLPPSDRFHWILANCNVRTTLKDLKNRVAVGETPHEPNIITYKGQSKYTRPTDNSIQQLDISNKFRRHGKL